MPAAKPRKPAEPKTTAKAAKPKITSKAPKSKATAKARSKPAAKTKPKPASKPKPVAPPLPPAAPSGVRCWLFKSEPNVFSIDALARDGTSPWDGIRNFQVRNYMRDSMKVGDLVLFYHSNADPPAVVGLARVSGAARPDPLQFDPSSHYHDPGSSLADPRWFLVDIAFVEKFPAEVGLPTLRSDPTLADMQVARNFRTSVQPVDPAHVLRVAELARATRVRDLLGAA